MLTDRRERRKQRSNLSIQLYRQEQIIVGLETAIPGWQHFGDAFSEANHLSIPRHAIRESQRSASSSNIVEEEYFKDDASHL